MIHTTCQTLVKLLALLLCAVLLGTALLYAAHALPDDAVLKNLPLSAALLSSEGVYPLAFGNDYSTMLDNFTDALMLSAAFYDGSESLTDKVFCSFSIIGGDPVSALQQWAYSGEKVLFGEYGRYWHGYVSILRPLLCVMNYDAIRTLNLIMQSLLMLTIAFFMWKKKIWYIIPSFFAAVIFLVPMSIYKSLQFSSVFYITMLGMLGMLLFDEKIKEKQAYPLYFAALGIATAYFDLLTFPPVSLGLPLVLYLVLKGPADFKSGLKDFLVLSLLWILSYATMWSSKWLLEGLFTNVDFAASLSQAIAFRTSSSYNGNEFALSQVLEKVFVFYSSSLYTVTFLATLAFSLFLFLRKLNYSNKRLLPRFFALAPLLPPMLIPLVWWRVLLNHSCIHPFPVKQVAIPIFALLCFLSAYGEMPFPAKSKSKNSRR